MKVGDCVVRNAETAHFLYLQKAISIELMNQIEVKLEDKLIQDVVYNLPKKNSININLNVLNLSLKEEGNVELCGFFQPFSLIFSSIKSIILS